MNSKGDTYVPKDQITFFVEHPANSDLVEEIQFPIIGKGKIADYGFKNPRFIKGKLVSVLENFTGLVFQFGSTETFGFPMMYFKRDKKFLDSETISSTEESITFNKMRDYSQSLSLQIASIDYMVGGKKSAPLSLIEQQTDLIDLKEDEESDCVICLNKLLKDEKCRKIQICGHIFHQDCIEKWLLRCKECPLCRKSIEITKE